MSNQQHFNYATCTFVQRQIYEVMMMIKNHKYMEQSG